MESKDKLEHLGPLQVPIYFGVREIFEKMDECQDGLEV